MWSWGKHWLYAFSSYNMLLLYFQITESEIFSNGHKKKKKGKKPNTFTQSCWNCLPQNTNLRLKAPVGEIKINQTKSKTKAVCIKGEAIDFS